MAKHNLPKHLHIAVYCIVPCAYSWCVTPTTDSTYPYVYGRFPPRTETFVENTKEAWTRKIQQNVLLQGSRVRK